jgi:CheY-like chemotaxis protein
MNRDERKTLTTAIPADGPQTRRPLIYLVDDEAVVLDLLARCLVRAGFRTEAFTSPVVACSAFAVADEKPELLITDFTMPEMDGLELARRCRALLPRLKVLSVSGTLTEEALRASGIVLEGCLKKPFTPDVFVAEVRRVLD